jgi:hypothetical protein
MNSGTGLVSRQYATPNDLRLGLPQIKGSFGFINNFAYRPTNVGDITYTVAQGGFSGIKSGSWDGSTELLFDTYRNNNLKNTLAPSSGKIASRGRTDERDFYTVIKVR